MKINIPYEEGLDGKSGIDTRYYGEDAKAFLKSINWYDEVDFIGKDCLIDDCERGIIIGFEDSDSAMDYYYIVYRPEEDRITYELANSYKLQVI